MKTTDRQLKCRGLFEAMSYPVSGASALVGNFCREVGEDLPCAFRKTNLDHGSQGLAQWRLERLASLMAFVKQRHPGATEAELPSWYGNMGEQVAFVDHELRTDYPLLREKLMRGGDVAALTADVCWQYERPNKALSGIALRIDYAKALAAHNTIPAADKGLSTLTLKPMNVVDHLQVEADAQVRQQTGGIVLAALGTLGGAATLIGTAAGSVPTWELVAAGVAALAVAMGLVGSVIAGHKASNVRTAISGVTPDAPPAAEVSHTPVVLPREAPPAAPAAPMSADEVERIVRDILAGGGTLAPSVTDAVQVGKDGLAVPRVTSGGATMTLGTASPIAEVK